MKTTKNIAKLSLNLKESFGLGLALVKQIADYHDIQIQVDSSSQSGTNFQLIF